MRKKIAAKKYIDIRKNCAKIGGENVIEDVFIVWPKASRLAAFRERSGYSQKTLSEVTHVPKRSIEDYEAGRRFINNAGAAQVVRLAHALDVRPEDLLENEK